VTRRQPGVVVLALVVLLAACGGPGPSGSGPGPAGSGAVPSQPAPGASGGAGGSLAIGDPAAGLATLPAYRATLAVRFAGTQAGASSAWSQEYTLTVVRQTGSRILGYAETGLGAEPAYPSLEGFASSSHYLRRTADAPCAAAFAATTDDPAALVEPASFLPRVRTMTPSGATQQVGGMTAQPFSFDAAAVVTGASAQASGSALIVPDSHLVLGLDLELKGGHDVFDADTEGTMTWAYRVEPIDPPTGSILPADCPTPLPDVPLMADAANVLRFPGYVAYETRSDVAAVAEFYAKAMPGAGFTADGEAYVSGLAASLGWAKGSDLVRVAVAIGTPTTVRITRHAGKDAPNPTPIPVPTTPAQAGQVRVVQALNLLMGSDATPSPFPSYHLEFTGDSPYWNDTKVGRDKIAISADVEGKNVHFTSRETKGGSTTSSEVYKMGEKDYEVVKGKAVEGGTLAALAWIMWPLDAIVALGIGSFRTTSAGTETVDGRTVEVYKVAGTLADDTSGMFASFGFPITSTSGTVWVDQATGALIKTVLDYKADVKDTSGTTKGSSSGHLEIAVSRIGRSPVALP